MPLAAVEDKRARGTFKAWRDEMAEKTPRAADYAWMVLARILAVAKDRGKISVNKCEKGGRVYSSDRADIIWTAADIEQFCRTASPVLQFVLLLALWTGQRLGDLLALPWSAYDGAYILPKLVFPKGAAAPHNKIDRIAEAIPAVTPI